MFGTKNTKKYQQIQKVLKSTKSTTRLVTACLSVEGILCLGIPGERSKAKQSKSVEGRVFASESACVISNVDQLAGIKWSFLCCSY